MKKVKIKLSKLELLFVALILIITFFTGFESVLRPLQAWDGWDNWLLRSKIFFIHNNLDMDYVRYAQDEYPLIIPLMGTVGYIVMGHVDDRSILLLFFMFYFALGSLFFLNAKKMFGTKFALILTFLLLSLQNLIRHGGRFEAGQSDLALAYYIFAASLLLLNFIKTKSIKTLIFLGLFLGIATQIKNEGVAFALIISSIACLYLIIWKRNKYIPLAFLAIVFLAIWQVYKRMNNFPSNFLLRSGLQIHFEKIIPVAIMFGKEFFNFQNWNLLWVLFVLTLVAYRKKIFQVKVLLGIVVLQFLSYFVVYILTPYYPTITDKLYIHLAPLALLIIGILLKPKILKLIHFYD